MRVPILVTMMCGVGACLDTSPEDELRALPFVEVLGLSKDAQIEAREDVTVLLSGAIRQVVEDWPISVETEGGLLVASTGQVAQDGARIDVHPADVWPLGATLVIDVRAGFEDAVGRALRVPDEGLLRFSTARPERDRTECEVVAPTPGGSFAVNLKLVVLRCLGADANADAKTDVDGDVDARPPEPMWLASESDPGDRGRLVYERSAEGGLALYRIAAEGHRCAGLCPSTTYQVQVEVPPWRIVSGKRGQIVTSSVADTIAPAVVQGTLHELDERPSIDLQASEDVVFSGYLKLLPSTVSSVEVPLNSAVVPAPRGRLVAPASLPNRQAYEMVVWAEDLAGHRADAVKIEGVTGAALDVSISEVVVAPLRDWGDSVGGGVPFDGRPGTGAVTSADAWIELVNEGDEVVDLVERDVVLSVRDGTPSLTHVADAPALYFGSGGDVHAWSPGEALVVRPRGDASKVNVRIDVLSGDRVLDTMALGPGGDHPGGRPPDTVHESVARDAFGRFRWCVPSPGDAGPAQVCMPL
ncbi:MAG: hypothetical protein H6729_03480 [Deltaproteobacteria bacterium]|nr:hypothetical protein [Deltaproteobacteria bacterium]